MYIMLSASPCMYAAATEVNNLYMSLREGKGWMIQRLSDSVVGRSEVGRFGGGMVQRLSGSEVGRFRGWAVGG